MPQSHEPIYSDVLFQSQYINVIAKQTIAALAYLDVNGIVHTNLEPKNLLLTNRCDTTSTAKVNGTKNSSISRLTVKLYDYGLGHMTNYGDYVAFPVFVNPAFTPPEVFRENPLLKGNGMGVGADDTREGIIPHDEATNCDSIVYIEPAHPPRYSSNCSVWSLGMILACQVLGIARPWPNLNASSQMMFANDGRLADFTSSPLLALSSSSACCRLRTPSTPAR